MLANYTRIKKLGQGSFGSVFLVRDNRDSQNYVLKEVDLTTLGAKGRKEALKEVGFLNKLSHPSIIAYKEFFEQEPQKGFGRKMLYIVMEYADGGDLSGRIKKQSNKPFTEQQIVDWLTQICLGLKHMHDRKIIHRDIKSENIFLTRNNLVKIGDFGISRNLPNTMANASTRIGTPYYLSPEICMNKPYNTKTDMWSLGIVLYEMMCLKLPFDSNSMEGLLKNIVRGSFPPPPRRYSQELRQIVDSLLEKDPKKRASVHQLLKMPVLQKNVRKFLDEHQMEEEFSHTILHSYNFKAPHIKDAKADAPLPEIKQARNPRDGAEEKVSARSRFDDEKSVDSFSPPSRAGGPSPMLPPSNYGRPPGSARNGNGYQAPLGPGRPAVDENRLGVPGIPAISRQPPKTSPADRTSNSEYGAYRRHAGRLSADEQMARAEAEKKAREDELERIRRNYWQERQEAKVVRVKAQQQSFSIFGDDNASISPPAGQSRKRPVGADNAYVPPASAHGYPRYDNPHGQYQPPQAYDEPRLPAPLARAEIVQSRLRQQNAAAQRNVRAPASNRQRGQVGGGWRL